jgi:kynureninase
MPTVTVGCKLPNGLIIELGDKRAELNGANSSEIVGGHGLTENVDKEFFDAWMEKYKDLDFVKAGHLFAHEKEVNVKAQAKEKAKSKTGFEKLSPDDAPKGVEAIKG